MLDITRRMVGVVVNQTRTKSYKDVEVRFRHKFATVIFHPSELKVVK